MAKAVAMLVAVALVVVAVNVTGAAAGDCKPEQLAECLPAIVSGSAPSAGCCSNLRAQQACLCQYAKDPAYGKYIGSPNARSMLKACGVAIPNCG